MKRLAGLMTLCACLMIAGGALADQTIVLSFLGDCTLGCEETMQAWSNSFMHTVEREGYAYFFQEVEPLLSGDDLTVANLEGVLKDNKYGLTQRIFNFRGATAYAQILADGSVEAVGLENNHAEDYGNAGRNSTRTALTDAGVRWFDSENACIYQQGNIQIAFISIWQQSVFHYGKQYDALIAGLKENGVNAVVVYMHFGEEYNPYHIDKQTETARRFIDAGADLIVGSHPHVLQGLDVYNGRMILYSLGNFVFGGNVNVRALETMIPQATLCFSDDGAYLWQQLTVWPANVSGDAQANDYQPRLVTGEAAAAVYALIDQDSTEFPIAYQQTDSCREYAQIPAKADESY